MPVWLHLQPEQVGKGRERKKINIIVPFRFYPTRNKKFQKNSKKNQKNFQKIIMAPFQATIADGGREKKKIKIIVSFRSYLTHNRKFQKNSKKIKKFNNTIMAPFRAKIGCKRMRKEENKNYRFVPFQPGAEQKMPKKIKK